MIKLGAAQVVDEAFDSIVRGAVEGVPGARLEFPGRVSRVLPGRRGPVEWSVTGSHATVSVEVVAAQGVVLPDLGDAVRGAVAIAVTDMTGLGVRAVDVTVTGIDREPEPRR
jgi:uncharacterized alkaline shock family protein YloU